MRILMLCDWLPPDFGAVGQYAVGFARELARDGDEVTLVGLSSRQRSELRESYARGSLLIRRIFRPVYDRNAFWDRAFWTLAANITLLWNARRELLRTHEVRFTGSPPYMLHFVMPLALILRRSTRYRITDFHPECLSAQRQRPSLLLALLQRATNFWRRRVNVIEVLGEDQRRVILACRVKPERIELVRDPSPADFSKRRPAAPVPLPLRDTKVILYSGNWGAAHDLETFVAGFARFEARHPGAAGLWLNATGAGADRVEQQFLLRNLRIARTQTVPLAELPAVLLAADLHLICLRDEFVGYVLPSKVYACIDSGRPILFVGSEKSDVHLLCAAAAGSDPLRYRRVDVGDCEGLCRALADLLLEKDAERGCQNLDFAQRRISGVLS